MALHSATASDLSARDFGLAVGAEYADRTPEAVREAVRVECAERGMSEVETQIASNCAWIAARNG